MKRHLRAVCFVFAMGVAAITNAASIAVTFPSSAATVVASVGSISATEIGYFWSVARGDRITESYASTGLFGATSLTMNLLVTQNVLAAGQSVIWDVLVNGVDVGDWTWSQADGVGSTTLNLLFPAIAGQFTSLALVVRNEVPSGLGSIAIGLNTRTIVRNDVPEPATVALLGLGLGLAGFAARRRSV